MVRSATFVHTSEVITIDAGPEHRDVRLAPLHVTFFLVLQKTDT